MANKNSRGTSISRYNVIATYGSGKAGNVRLYQKGERSYVRAAYNSTVNNPRTDAQMRQRLLFTSMGNFLSAMNTKGLLLSENKTPYRSAVNIMRSMNQGIGAYFTKSQSVGKNILLQSCVISEGSIMPIEIEPIDYSVTSTAAVGQCNYSCWKSNLYLGTSTLYDHMSVTTVGQFSNVLLGNNPELLPGDELWICEFTQTGSTGAGMFVRPLRVSTVVRKITLDVNDETELHLKSFGVLGLEPNLTSCGIVKSTGPIVYDYYLGWSSASSNPTQVPALGTACPDRKGVAFVIVRKSDGLKCSSSKIAVNNETLINMFTSNEAFVTAKASYGTAQTSNGTTVLIQTQAVGIAGEPVDSSVGTVTGGGTYNVGEKVRIEAAAASASVEMSGLGMGLPAENTIVSSGVGYIEFIANVPCVVGAMFEAE